MSAETFDYDSLPEDVVRLTPESLKFLKAKQKFIEGCGNITETANHIIVSQRDSECKTLDDMSAHPENYRKDGYHIMVAHLLGLLPEEGSTVEPPKIKIDELHIFLAEQIGYKVRK